MNNPPSGEQKIYDLLKRESTEEEMGEINKYALDCLEAHVKKGIDTTISSARERMSRFQTQETSRILRLLVRIRKAVLDQQKRISICGIPRVYSSHVNARIRELLLIEFAEDMIIENTRLAELLMMQSEALRFIGGDLSPKGQEN